MAFLYTLVAFIFSVLAVKFFLLTKRPPNPRLPPSPPKLPFIGNLHQLGALPHVSIHRLSQKLGPIVYLKFGSIPTVVVSSPRLAEKVLKTHDLAFANRPKFYAAKNLLYDCTDIGFAPYGAYWREAKKICTLELLSQKQVQRYELVRSEQVSRLVNRIKDSCYPKTVNLSQLIAMYTNDVVCQISLGRDFSGSGGYDRHGFPEMIGELMNLLGGFSLAELFPSLEFVGSITGFKRRLRKASDRFDRFFDEVIEEHQNRRGNTEEPSKDLVDVLLEIQSDASREITLTLDNVKAIILDMFVAGTDTSSITLDWAMTELITNPRVLRKAQAEVRQVVGDRGVVLESDMSNLHYMKAVIKEILRLHPPVPFLVPRESLHNVVIDNYEIPATTRILVNVWGMGRDSDVWQKPNQFEPERFLGSSIDYKDQDFRFIPFGGGRRTCPGISFAIAIIELALAHLLYNFDWVLPPGIETKDLDRTEVFGLTLHKKDKLLVVAKPHFL